MRASRTAYCSIIPWLLWVVLVFMLAAWGWNAGHRSRKVTATPTPTAQAFIPPLRTSPAPLPPPPYVPLPPPQTAGPLTINYNATYHYDPYRASFCFVVRLQPRDLRDLPVFVASLASGQYANLRVWLVGGELTDEMWASVGDDISSLQSAFARRFVYSMPQAFDDHTSILPARHRNLIMAERFAASLSSASYGQLLSEFDPACRENPECFNPPLANLRAPLCDYIVHTTASHIYNVQYADALREATDAHADVIAYDFVSAKDEHTGECVARPAGGQDSQVFAQWRPSCLRLAAVAFRAGFLRKCGLHFIEAEEMHEAGSRPLEYYGSLFPLRLLQIAEAHIVHRVLVFEQRLPE